jgi:hypothetical protein
MKLSPNLPLILLTAGLLAVPCGQAATPRDENALNAARSAIEAERQAVVTDALQLTAAEAERFWPLYRQYRAEMDRVGDRLVQLVKEYAQGYPEVPEDRAKQMLKDLTTLEKKHVATRTTFLKKFGKVLPAAKNLRFAQVEGRLDLALRLELAAGIPLIPIAGDLSADGSRGSAYAPGVPGGLMVQTVQLTATVIAINKASRSVTLLSRDGIKQTVKVGPEAINFEQIRVGDTLQLVVTEELVVHLAGSDEALDDGGAALVALAPRGAKPGGVVAETTQVIATVTAIDQSKHTATLRFEDGSTRVFPVRRDVNLGKRKVGEKVLFRVTEMIALSVEKAR